MAHRVIAIDGPAGSGKSTVARAVADRLGLEYLDTGAMYRGVAFAVLQRGVDPADVTAVADVARSVTLEVTRSACIVDGEDASAAIRGAEVTTAVTAVAANPEVRVEMVARQRSWVLERGGGVMEGRDIGSVVFPEAELKVHLIASPEVRHSAGPPRRRASTWLPWRPTSDAGTSPIPAVRPARSWRRPEPRSSTPRTWRSRRSSMRSSGCCRER